MDDWIKLAALFLSLLSTAVIWRVQIIGKRRFEVAEEALIAFAKCKDALAHVRGALSYGGEGKSRPKEDGEKPEDAERLDRQFVPYERLNRVAESFVSLRKSQLLCLFHFGKEAYDAMDALFKARSDVHLAAMLIADEQRGQRFREATPEEEKMSREAHGDLYATGGKYDVIAIKIATAETTLEAVCGPYLKYRSAFWPEAWTRWWMRRKC